MKQLEGDLSKVNDELNTIEDEMESLLTSFWSGCVSIIPYIKKYVSGPNNCHPQIQEKFRK